MSKIYRHIRRSTMYEVITDNGEISTNGPSEGQRVVVYRSLTDQKVYVRNYSEFMDGRFELVLDTEKNKQS